MTYHCGGIIMNMSDFKERDLKDVIKIICDQKFFNDLVDFPNIIMKDDICYYKGVPISIDENLKYKTCELVYKINDNFYDGIVNNLKQEAKHLNNKISIFRSKHDIQNCIVALKALRETLDLIKKYDWQLMYSEYGVENTNNQLNKLEDILNLFNENIKKDDNTYKNTSEVFEILTKLWNEPKSESKFITEIAVWEQNHDGQIRNHKVWRTDIEYKKYKYIVDNEIRP